MWMLVRWDGLERSRWRRRERRWVCVEGGRRLGMMWRPAYRQAWGRRRVDLVGGVVGGVKGELS